MHRIVIIANKTWEVDPLIACLLNEKARPTLLPLPTIVNSPRRKSQGYTNPPRLVYKFGDALQIEVWCIQDLMDPTKSPSSSEEKATILPKIKDYCPTPPDLIIAFGTASIPKTESYNGCVSIGTKMFVHNGHPDPNDLNTSSHWQYGKFDQLLESPNSKPFFAGFDPQFRLNVESRLLTPPINPAKYLTFIASPAQSGLSNANITDYNEYAWLDQQGVDKFNSNHFKTELVSVETTHGIIRAIFDDIPFIFFSGITDRVNYFNAEVAPKDYSQNFVAAHNAGIALAWFMPYLTNLYAKDLSISKDLRLSDRHYFADIVQPSRQSMTISGVFSDMVLTAEQWYGKRNTDVTLGGIEFWDGARSRFEYYPYANNKFCTIQLRKHLMTDDQFSNLYYELAQEALHFLCQSPYAIVFEEGLSIVFAQKYMMERFGIPFSDSQDSYGTAHEKVKQLIDLDSKIIEKLRKAKTNLTEITPDLIIAQCDNPCPKELSEELCKRF